jgi:mono/diheme cytochrome c family protein
LKRPNLSLLAALITGLMLSACEKAPDSVATQAVANQDEGPLDRNLDPAQVARGLAIYKKSCAECHGAEGKGQPGDWRIPGADGKYPPPPLDDSAHAWHHPTAALLYVIYEGSPGGQGNMPAWKDRLSEHEMQDVVVYIKSLWSDPVYRLWSKTEQQSLQQ